MAKPNGTATKNVTTEGLTERIVNGFKLQKMAIPEGTTQGRTSKYPFAQMQIGDAFEVVGIKAANSIRNATAKYQAGHKDYRFSTRYARTQEDGTTVYLCQRIPVADSSAKE